ERIALFIDKDEEKSLVLDDRPAKTPAKLSPIFIILFDVIEIVEPATGVERGITVVPEEAAAELICSRSCHHLYLSRAAFRFGVDWSSDDADFLNQVGPDKVDGVCAMIVAAVGNDEAVPRGI